MTWPRLTRGPPTSFILLAFLATAVTVWFLVVGQASYALHDIQLPGYHRQDCPLPEPVLYKPKTIESCEDCLPGDPFCDDYGPDMIFRSRAYEGSGSRIQRVLKKAIQGEGLKFGVLGGSVTHGHGLPEPARETVKHVWHHRFFRWFNATIPHEENMLIDGSIPGTTTAYYAYCFPEHIPDDVDVVLIEMAINDPSRSDYSWHTADNMIRGVLALPHRPAIVMVEVFALEFEWMGSAGDQHLAISRHYDIPYISMRNPILPHLLHHPEDAAYAFSGWSGRLDLRHMSPPMHYGTADIVSSYFAKQLCLSRREIAHPRLTALEGRPNGGQKIVGLDVEPWVFGTKWVRPEDREVIPRLSLLDKWDEERTLGNSAAQCRSVVGSRKKLVPVAITNGTLPGTKTVGTGWYEWSSSPDKHYWVSKSPGARITFAITVGLGDVEIFFLASKTFGLGDALCWVDDDRRMASRLEGWWPRETNQGEVKRIRTGLSPGDHLLHCEIPEKNRNKNSVGHEFRIITVMTS